MTTGSWVLTVDGGGTKTDLLLVHVLNGDWKIQSRQHSGPANLSTGDTASTLATLDQAIDKLCQDSGIATSDLESTVIALAGLRSESIRAKTQCWADRRFGQRYRLLSDVELVLTIAEHIADADDTAALALIAGTGSIAIGSRLGADFDNEPSVYAGGWGHLLGDEGGGYWLGREGLRVAYADLESSNTKSSLLKLSQRICELADATSARELIAYHLQQANVVSSIASLAKPICEWAEQGDRQCLDLLESAARHLGVLVVNVSDRLGSPKPFSLAIAGGLIANSALLQRMLKSCLQTAGLETQTVSIIDDPVMTAAHLAISLIDH